MDEARAAATRPDPQGAPDRQGCLDWIEYVLWLTGDPMPVAADTRCRTDHCGRGDHAPWERGLHGRERTLRREYGEVAHLIVRP